MTFKLMPIQFFIVLISLSFVACSTAPNAPDADSSLVASTGSTPDWVIHPQALYPETRYLAAVGSGNSRNEAIQDAKKNLAESFMVKVQSETKSHHESTMTSDTGGAAAGKAEQNMNKDLTLSTETFLRGADVKEVYEGKEIFALVALDKLKARSGLMLEAQRSQAKLDQLYDLLKEQYTGEKWNEAQAELKKFDGLYSEAAALGMSALVNSGEYVRKFGQLDRLNRGKTKKIIFTVKMNEGEEFFQNDLEACIGERGGTVYSAEKPPAQANKISINLIERPQHYPVEGWTKMRFDLTASVTQADGKLFRIQSSKTETGRSRDAVLEAASDSLSKEFCDKLFARIGEM